MMSTEKIGKLKHKIALITILATLALSVLVLADVIYYYRGVITAQVSPPPISFFQGPNGYAPPYVVATPTSTGFNLVIQITNASYIYYYEVLGLNAYSWCWLYVTNVTATPTLISNLMVIHTNTTKPDILYIAGDLSISTNTVTNADLSIVHGRLLEDPHGSMVIAIPTKRDLKFSIHCSKHLLPRTKQLHPTTGPKLPEPRTVS